MAFFAMLGWGGFFCHSWCPSTSCWGTFAAHSLNFLSFSLRAGAAFDPSFEGGSGLFAWLGMSTLQRINISLMCLVEGALIPLFRAQRFHESRGIRPLLHPALVPFLSVFNGYESNLGVMAEDIPGMEETGDRSNLHIGLGHDRNEPPLVRAPGDVPAHRLRQGGVDEEDHGIPTRLEHLVDVPHEALALGCVRVQDGLELVLVLESQGALAGGCVPHRQKDLLVRGLHGLGELPVEGLFGQVADRPIIESQRVPFRGVLRHGGKHRSHEIAVDVVPVRLLVGGQHSLRVGLGLPGILGHALLKRDLGLGRGRGRLCLG